jgi:L-ribulose-5-phosphate 4-epimerase
MQAVEGAGCWPGQVRGRIVWGAPAPAVPAEAPAERAHEVLRFRAGLTQAVADVERWLEHQSTVEGRVLVQGYRDALLDDAWTQRASALIDGQGTVAGDAALQAAAELGAVLRRSAALAARADQLVAVAEWLAGRLSQPLPLPPDTVLAAPDLSPLQVLDLRCPALIAGAEPTVTGTGVLVWGVPHLGPDWNGRWVAIDGVQVTLDAPEPHRPAASPPSPEEDRMRYQETRQDVCEYARRMMRDGLVKLTSGNISARIPGTNFFAITPSGMDYETLEPTDIVVLDMDLNVVEGSRRPSTERAMHRAAYMRRPDVGGVVHTHSIYASAFACLGRPMDVISTELAMLVGATIACAPYAKSGTEEFAEAALNSLGAEALAVLLQNHGALAVGRTLKEAYSVAVGLEEAAMIFHLASQLGTPIVIPQAERERMFREFRRSYGQPANREES